MRITETDKTSKLVELLDMDIPVSGEIISDRLGISRAMVWKKIKTLRSKGFIIEGIPSRGYRLVEKPYDLASELLTTATQNKIIGKKILILENTSSTHTLAKKYAADGCAEGTVIAAKKQSAGRGRLGRIWESPRGGLWISVVLRPDIPLTEINKLGLVASLSVSESLKKYCSESGIKWPNDIVVKDRKIGGVLMEASGEPDSLDYLILSVGININFKSSEIAENAPNAVTLYDITNKKTDLNTFLLNFLGILENKYFKLRNNGWPAMHRRIINADRFAGKQVTVQFAGNKIAGIYDKINADGALSLVTGNGDATTIPIGEIIEVSS